MVIFNHYEDMTDGYTDRDCFCDDMVSDTSYISPYATGNSNSSTRKKVKKVILLL